MQPANQILKIQYFICNKLLLKISYTPTNNQKKLTLKHWSPVSDAHKTFSSTQFQVALTTTENKNLTKSYKNHLLNSYNNSSNKQPIATCALREGVNCLPAATAKAKVAAKHKIASKHTKPIQFIVSLCIELLLLLLQLHHLLAQARRNLSRAQAYKQHYALCC